MAGWHHWLDGCESEWTPGVSDGQGGLACCDSWGRKEADMTERLIWSYLIWYISDGLAGKESTCFAGDTGDAGWNPGSGRSPGGGHGNPLQDPCLKNARDRGTWWATVRGFTESDTTKGMNRDTHISKSELYEIICKNNNNKVLSFKLLYEIIKKLLSQT